MTDKPTGVFVQLHDGELTEQQREAFIAVMDCGGTAEEAISAIGTPVTGGELAVVGYITDNRPFDTNTLTHWILYKHRQHDREYGVVLQSDALAKLAEKDAEIARLREYYEASEALNEVGLFNATPEMFARERSARKALKGSEA